MVSYSSDNYKNIRLGNRCQAAVSHITESYKSADDCIRVKKKEYKSVEKLL